MSATPKDGSIGSVTAFTAEGVSWSRLVRAIWAARAKPWDEPSAMAYQASNGVMISAILVSAIVEIIITDFLIPVTWARVLVGLIELLVLFVLISFIVALRAYPHRVMGEALEINYGATFGLSVPLSLIDEVVERKGMTGQTRTAEISKGVLSVPFMGESNVVLSTTVPVGIQLSRSDVAEVREIRLFAKDPGAAVRALSNGDRRVAEEAAVRPPRTSPGWVRALRWIGLAVLIIEVALVRSGVLDWRTAAGILVVTEGTLGTLGIVASATLINHYRRNRAAGRSRSESVREALNFILPVQLVSLVGRELSVFRIVGLLASRRIESFVPGDVPLRYGRSSRLLRIGTALLIGWAGIGVLLWLTPGFGFYALGVILVYAGWLTAVAALASRVRPHLLKRDDLLLRWGMHQELSLTLASIRSVGLGAAQVSSRPAEDLFRVPAGGREQMLLELREVVGVPTSLGRVRPVTTIVVPVDDAGTAVPTIAARLAREFAGKPTGETAGEAARDEPESGVLET